MKRGNGLLEAMRSRARYDVFTSQRGAHIDGQTLPRVVVDDRQRAQTPTVKQRISDEVHAPDLVDLGHYGVIVLFVPFLAV
jgi:hypothetical protein